MDPLLPSLASRLVPESGARCRGGPWYSYKPQTCVHTCVTGLENLQSTSDLEKVGTPVPAPGRADGASWRELRGGHPLACPRVEIHASKGQA
jgi:hypothetical protein